MYRLIKEKVINFLNANTGSDLLEFILHAKNYAAANILGRGLAFISIPIFTRLLSPADYGILAIFLSFLGVVSIIMGMGIRGSIIRYYYEETDDFDSFLGTNLVFILGWSIVVLIILVLLKPTLIGFFNIPFTLLLLGGVIAFLNITFQNYTGYLQASKRSKTVFNLNATRSVIILAFAIVITIMLTDNRYYGKVIANLITSIIFFIICLKPLLKLSSLNIKKKHIKYSLVFGIPIVFHLLSGRVLIDFDRIIINQLVGNKEAGLYSFAYNVGMIQNLISMGMLTAWTPMFYAKLNEQRYGEISKLASKYARLVYILAFTLILFSREIVILLADKEYHAAFEIVPIIVVSYVFFFLYTMYVEFAFYAKKTYMIAVLTIIAGSINVGLNYLLIPKYGYQVAAWTTLISYASLLLLHYCNVRFIIKPQWFMKMKVLLPNFFIMIIFVFLSVIILKETHQLYIRFCIKVILLSTLIFIYFGRRIIRKIQN